MLSFALAAVVGGTVWRLLTGTEKVTAKTACRTHVLMSDRQIASIFQYRLIQVMVSQKTGLNSQSTKPV